MWSCRGSEGGQKGVRRGSEGGPKGSVEGSNVAGRGLGGGQGGDPEVNRVFVDFLILVTLLVQRVAQLSKQTDFGRVQCIDSSARPLRLAPDPGICSLPPFDWPLTREYARSPPSIRP
eukprot:1184502-Prorocentrum_minimum.AAC.1